MFIDELTPIFKELAQHPISFMGGLFSGALRLNLKEDPVKSWLSQQTDSSSTNTKTNSNNGKSTGPQRISID
jgi:hypothetical protein